MAVTTNKALLFLAGGVAAAAASLYHPTCSAGVGSVASCLALADRLGSNPLPA